LLKKTLHNLSSNGASFKTIVKLISQRFAIGENLAREVVIWRIKEDELSYEIFGENEFIEIKLASADEHFGSKRKKGHCTYEESEKKVAVWESKSIAMDHSYKDEVFQHLLDVEKSQPTA